MRKVFVLLVFSCLVYCTSLRGQSLEVVPGTERFFVDAQWLKQFQDPRWSLFSRSRATDDYRNNTNLFTGAYLNFTTSKGFGATLVGRMSSLGSGVDAGVHFFKGHERYMVYALASLELANELSYSWFSIVRFFPPLTEKWKLYSSLEMFTNFADQLHVASVQRIRVGVDRAGLQFGVAANFSGLGPNYGSTDTNPGLFLRRQF